ncbi:hypothetical protein HMPREF9080_00285 [Cardiobacterium valvarum F0432]|uniref:Uncharacterized protein n=1 Tax=Cardiobacterium valvarum F0432 TaxID=797473 RepID=G9ZC07_9GAMM|nr:hypothetical protein HMPREF9080_00285 [Cardiobacterium valvarum F0432]
MEATKNRHHYKTPPSGITAQFLITTADLETSPATSSCWCNGQKRCYKSL